MPALVRRALMRHAVRRKAWRGGGWNDPTFESGSKNSATSSG
jgi:hypothetical protein